MTVLSVFFGFNGARDIHLLPGMVSPRLDQLMFIEDETPDPKRSDTKPGGITPTFQALIAGPPEDRGVIFNEATGEVEIMSPLPAGPRLRSFIVVCGCNEGSNIFTVSIRVHVHESIDAMWLTPSVLHVRQGAENMRFGVLARFKDDLVIGDITNWSQFVKPNPPDPDDRTFVHLKNDNAPALAWSSPNVGGVTVDPDTGELSCGSATANERIEVARRPLPAPVTHLARAQVLGAPAWTTPVKLTHVQGKGFAAMSTTSNILFLPEGFLNNPRDRREFCHLVRGVVRRLTYHPQTTPFDLLSQRQHFNYFMAWVPSPEPGVTVLNELDRINVSGTQAEGIKIAEPVPARMPLPPPSVMTWNLQELLHEVGPPTPNFDPAGSPLGTDATTPDGTDATGHLGEWRELYGPHINSGLVAGVYQSWLDLNDRVLLNELDTAFHLAMSDRPRVDGVVTAREVVFNKLRLTNADFDRFLGALADGQGNAVGGVWASGGKDEDMVVILCRSLRSGGSNTTRDPSGHYMALNMADDVVHHLEEVIVGDGFDLVADQIATEVSADLWTTVAHELAHSWTLRDEYGGNGVIGDDRADKLKDFANVQPRKTLLTANSLDADKIKWRWPRIAKAGVIVDVPTDESGAGTGPFRVKMFKNHGYQFGRGDIVRLRTRPLPTAVTSDRLKINRMLADGDLIELVLMPGSTLNVAAFPSGSVLISPKRAKDNADGSPGDDLELVHPMVRAHINTTHNPLNAAHTEGADRACPGVEMPTPTGATSYPPGTAPKPPRYSSWIVGLHENGDTFDCDVYHPTGVCLMRQQTFIEVTRRPPRPPTAVDRAYEFCPVCRYAIADFLDPSIHRDVDHGLRTRFLK